jgi:hypothetical protein
MLLKLNGAVGIVKEPALGPPLPGEGWLEDSSRREIHNFHLSVVGCIRPLDDKIVPCEIRHSISVLDGVNDIRACRLFFRIAELKWSGLAVGNLRHWIILELGQKLGFLPRRLASDCCKHRRPKGGNDTPGKSHPRPTNGILVAITVMNCTFASSGRFAI